MCPRRSFQVAINRPLPPQPPLSLERERAQEVSSTSHVRARPQGPVFDIRMPLERSLGVTSFLLS